MIHDFVGSDYGRGYGVTATEREKMVEAFFRNTREIKSGTPAVLHAILAREILSIPPNVIGDVIECGAWKGASSASLSIVCKRIGRQLVICDSFEGLPDDGLAVHVAPHFGTYGYYKEGMFCGKIDEVRKNILRCGELSVCDFLKGFFSDSLRKLSRPISFAFLDVDLVSSTRDCLKYIWPLLVECGKIFTDDAGDMDVVRVFFDEAWWQEKLKSSAPGYVGSGCGLPLNSNFSTLGYTRKLTRFDSKMWHTADHLHYPEKDQMETTPQ